MPNGKPKPFPQSPGLALLFLFIVLLFGFAAGYLSASKLAWKDGYAAGKAGRPDAPAPAGPQDDDGTSAVGTVDEDEAVTELTGTVTAVGDASITFTVSEEPKTRVASVTEATSIVVIRRKDAAVLQAEQDAYLNALAAYEAEEADDPSTPPVSGPPVPPLPDAATAGTLADITVGSKVTVMADDDIATAASFEATAVLVLAGGAGAE
jgi:hypothetical protein